MVGGKSMGKTTTVLMILDGYGISEHQEGNAVFLAKTPVIDGLKEKYPFVKGYASGLDVGLPEGQMGNSEVGHLNIGAGRIVYQELTRISKSVEDGDFYENNALLEAVEYCKKNNSAIHFMGLLSDGGVHSHNNHLYALLRLAKKHELTKVFVHAFLDGRDTPPSSGLSYLMQLEEKIREIGVGQIATICGRYYAMDRDKRWERVEVAYRALTEGKGVLATDIDASMRSSYEKDITDEFVMPTVMIDEAGRPLGKISSNDSIIFFNFRPDRARELTRAYCDVDFDGFERGNFVENLKYVCFTEYDSTIENKVVAFKPQKLYNTLGQYLSSLGKKQLRTAETEKYAHVTFFFNGGVEEPDEGETRQLISSPKVATYDLQPEMSAIVLTNGLIKAIESKEYDFIVVNYANPDMVGHTGILEATIQALETVDVCVGRVVNALIGAKAKMFICADHGNSEQLIDYETGEPFTAHTTNPVPFILVNGGDGISLRERGRLCDIAPTLLQLMELPIPKEMRGESLLVGK